MRAARAKNVVIVRLPRINRWRRCDSRYAYLRSRWHRGTYVLLRCRERVYGDATPALMRYAWRNYQTRAYVLRTAAAGAAYRLSRTAH